MGRLGQRRDAPTACRCIKGLEQMSREVSNTAQLYAAREPSMKLVKSNWGVRMERTESERRLRGGFITKKRNVT